MDTQEPDSSLERVAVAPPAGPPVPVIVHMSGKRRGEIQRLSGDTVRIGAHPEDEIRVSPEPQVAAHHATLHRKGDTYELVAGPDRPVWVNGKKVSRRLLVSGDVLEIGRDGPVVRFRLYPPGTRELESDAEAFSDSAGSRYGSQTPAARAAVLVAGALKEMAIQTAVWLRVVIVVLFLLLVVTVYLALRSSRMERRFERQVEGIAQLLEAADSRSLRPEHLAGLRLELVDTEERLKVLEERSEAPARVVATAEPSVILLQGSYSFVEPESGELLRFLGLGPDGRALRNPLGEPVVGVGGEGPPVEVHFTGSGFVASGDGLLLTNRHLAVPWEYDSAARRVVAQGFVPAMNRFIGWLPERKESVEVELVVASETEDLAALRASGLAGIAAALEIDEDPPHAGDEIIVLGYPGGIAALLARADEELARQVMEGDTPSFWEVVDRLAQAGHIAPLASRGIVAQVSRSAVVYDAETTRGGSGGPVLNLEGQVVAISSGIVTDVGGSNIGVPAAGARSLLLAASELSSAR